MSDSDLLHFGVKLLPRAAERNTMIRLALALSFAASLFAATPVATLSSTGPVKVAGVEMSASSVAFWPVANGDVIEPMKSAAVLLLPDHSRITVYPGTRAQIQAKGAVVSVKLLSGAADYKLASRSSVQLFVADKFLQAATLQGTIGNAVAAQNDGGRRNSSASGNTTPIFSTPTLPAPPSPTL
jgi:hypothetical protein